MTTTTTRYPALHDALAKRGREWGAINATAMREINQMPEFFASHQKYTLGTGAHGGTPPARPPQPWVGDVARGYVTRKDD